MGGTTTDEVASTLVAYVDLAGRDFLEGAALAGRTVRVPLSAVPREDALHVLAVRTPGLEAPLLLLARAMGPYSSKGYPLALRASLVGRALAGGKLVIRAPVREGAAGIVYRARHRDLEIDLAVKVLHERLHGDADFVRRFHTEALSASRLDHPNLTRVVDFGQEPDGLFYLAMEFLDGKSLREIIDEEGPLPLARAVPLMIQVCSGLTHAHARGVVHRDIKPENLVLANGLDDDGHDMELVKLCDFGVAEIGGEHREPAGTPDYMAPEQLRGEAADAQSDVYACGIVLYELLTGDVPFTGSVAELLQLHETASIDAPSTRVADLDVGLDQVALRALAKDRGQRYASVRELRAALRTLLDEAAFLPSSDLHALEDSGAPTPVAPQPVAPPPVAKQPPAAAQPEWLEAGRGYLASVMPSMIPTAVSSLTSPSAAALAPARVPSMGSDSVAPPSDVARAMAPFLRQLSETRGAREFAELTRPLDVKIRALAEQRHAGALWRLRSTLDMIAAEDDDPSANGRAASARRLLEVLEDPKVLGPLADRALDGIEDKDKMAAKVVVRAGVGGAYALYAARLKNDELTAREHFVALLKQIGEVAVPLIRSGLVKLEARLTVAAAESIAEDLIAAVAQISDEATGEVVARYTRCAQPRLVRAAAAALPALCGGRARPVLLVLVEHADESVAVAAIDGLREMRGIDRAFVASIEPMVMGTTSARLSVRAAALAALAAPSAEAVVSARGLCVKVMTSLAGATPDVEQLIAAAAASFVSAGGDAAFVAERARSSSDWLRARLEAVVNRARTSKG